MRVDSGHEAELGKTTVAFRAQKLGRRDAARIALGTTVGIADNALPYSPRHHVGSDGDDVARHVGTLNAWKRDIAGPRSHSPLGDLKASCAAFRSGARRDTLVVPTRSRIDVGVVHPCDVNVDQHLADAGPRNR